MSELLIKNGDVVFEKSVEPADILIRDGKIAGFFARSGFAGRAETLDATGLHIMAGSIDPHTHWGIYKPYERDVKEDSRRAIIGGLTTVLQFHRSNGDYFDTVPESIAICNKESYVDYTFSLGLIKKSHVEDLARYRRELKINSFKFYLDKTGVLEQHYGLTKGTGLRGDKKDVLDILKRLKVIDPAATLCLHCEDTEIFYSIKDEVFAAGGGSSQSLADYSALRPAYGEVSSVLSVLWVNHLAEGRIYIVHTSAGDAVRLARTLKPELRGEVFIETCPHYLALDENAACGLNATVVPPIRTAADSEELWRGISDGTVTSIGTDNCPIDTAKKYSKGNNIKDVFPGFPGAGIILPVLISDGYFKRNIPLPVLAGVNSANAARTFGLKGKGEIKIGFDADLALVDLNWERTVDPALFGGCDFSIYAGMRLKGWPRYTLLRGKIIQKDGEIVAEPDGKFIER
jgi:dihydropyrimidinase